MKSVISVISLLTLLLLSTFTFAQVNYDADLILPQLRSRANACIRNEEITVDMRAPDNVIRLQKKVITVFNENGDDDARMVIGYDKNTSIKSIKGEIYNAAGILTSKFNLNNFSDVSAADGFSLFIDSRLKYFRPSVNQYPYTVSYEIETRNKQNLIIRDWVPALENNISVEKSSYTFISKPADQVRIQMQNYKGEPVETIDEKQKKQVWLISNLAATRSEPYSPDPEHYLTKVQIAPKQFYYYGRTGSYSNWQDLGKWVYDDLLKERTALPIPTLQAIKILVKDDSNEKEKARKIYKYLQEKTRYISVQIGIGGFQPVAASEIDRLGYGDCKALVNYMQSLLKAADIESYYCVVEAGSLKKNIDPAFASMAQGNHIILCLPLKGDTTWLECTNQKIPFGFLSDFTDDRIVFACTPTGGKLLKTPKLSAQNNLQIRKAELNISQDGDITGKINTLFSGAQYDNREIIIDHPLAEQRKLLKTAYNVDNIDFTDVGFSQKKEISPQLTEDLKLSIRNYAPINGTKMYLQLNAFNIQPTIQELNSRMLPVYINRGFTDEDTIEYELPENVKTELILIEDKNLKNPFGEYKRSVSKQGRKLTYYRKLVLNDGTFPPEKYAEFSKFINDVNIADHLKLVLNLK
ncbi:DUF3857 domain-containing protein [Pedobacter petrophilus]|uniref:DUF3857 domain-containing protein n=1 Tax=Pedobacter petrophilus TaxID=1908241 RepID=A0A7K0FWW9_9SPHI|nr:DUF3857 domain-containing protein [Pedobacter petrophilus]MRX75901.1 DUF3857 domain-containing protein [Pedobacter petrophilus]